MNLNKKIKDIADLLASKQEVYTRADLAFNLSDFGIESDSLKVAEIVFVAYNYYKMDAVIASVFKTNDLNESLVENYKNLVDLQEFRDRYFNSLRAKNKVAIDNILGLESKVGQFDLEQSGKTSSLHPKKALQFVTGVSGLNNIKAAASDLFERYQMLIDSYRTSTNQVKMSINDFTRIRADIHELFLTFTTSLLDVYGDRIKVVDPTLFDFDSLEYLDTASMYQAIKLEYDNIFNSCVGVIGELEGNFKIALVKSAQNYKSHSKGDRQMALLLAGMSLGKHYIDAKEKELTLKSDFIVFKSKVKQDVSTITGDTARLVTIQKNIDEILIPQAEIFYKHAGKLLKGEYGNLLSALKENAEVRLLSEERDALLIDRKKLKAQINDHQLSIADYKVSEEETNQFLANNKDRYDQAVRMKPKKGLLNVLTFGALDTGYNRKVYEWQASYGRYIENYQALLTEAKIIDAELVSHQNQLTKANEQLNKLNLRIGSLTDQMLAKVQLADHVKRSMSNHLVDIVKLLKLAKGILNSKINDSLKGAYIYSDKGFLDESVLQRIEKFAEPFVLRETGHKKIMNRVSDHFSVSTDALIIKPQSENANSEHRDVNQSTIPSDAEQLRIRENRLALSNKINDESSLLIDSSVSLYTSYLKLESIKGHEADADASAEREMALLRKKFQENMRNIDDKAMVIGKVIAAVNSSAGDSELKKSLLVLLGDEPGFELEDIDAFLRNEKKIVI